MSNEATFTPVDYQLTENLSVKGFRYSPFAASEQIKKAEHSAELEKQVEQSAEQTAQQSSPRVVLFLHGWLDNAASFSPLFTELVTAFENSSTAPALLKSQPIDFIAIDLIGHGLSSHRSSDAHYHFYDWIYDILLLMEHNHWQQIDIVGHSMGGMIASTFASAFPEKTTSLTLIDALGYFTVAPKHTTKQLRKGLLSRIKHLQRSKQVTSSVGHYGDINLAIQARVDCSDLPFEHAKFIVERGIKESEHGLVWRSDKRLKAVSPYRLTAEQALQLIKDISMPVLLIYGSKGHDMVPSGLNAVANHIKQLTVNELEGGHHIHMEKPKPTAEFLLDFLTI